MWYRSFRREALMVLFRTFVVVVAIVFIVAFFGVYYESEEFAISDGSCNVAVLPVEGVIVPYNSFASFELVVTPAQVRDFVMRAEADPYIEGILYEVNSPGGTPVAAEQISEIIRDSALPSVSLIGDIGTSGGYLVAAAADQVVASPMSDVGSIGVTMSYVEESEKNEEEGLTFVSLSSGKFKDAGNPNKPLTEEERVLFEGDLKLIHDELVRQVAALRGLPLEQVLALADGAPMPGVRGLQSGLVDRLGGRAVAREEFSATLGKDVADIIFCEYEPVTFFY